MDFILRKALRKINGLRQQLDNVLLGDAEFKKFLAKRPCWVTEVKKEVERIKKTLTPFITITVGGTTKDKLIADMEVMPAEVTLYAKGMMANEAFTISKEVGKVDLVSLTIADLGFTTQTRTDAFMTGKFCAEWSAKHLDGYIIELCQPEDGPQLRKQWKDQPNGTFVWMAMDRINSGGGPGVFGVERRSGGGRWLSGGWVFPDDLWYLGRRFVFRLRKISA